MGLQPKSNNLRRLLLEAGILGYVLRVLLYTTGQDDSGLLIRGHWAATALLILTCSVAIGLLIGIRGIKGPSDYAAAFPPSVLRAAGAGVAAIAFLLSPGPEAPGSALGVLETALRFGSVISLLIIGFCRFQGKKPSFLLHCILCLHLAIRLICLYRIWSSDPRLQDYCYYLGAYIALMLTSYQFAAFDAGFGNHKKLWGCGLAAVYLSVLSLQGVGEPLLMVCCSIWVYTNLSNLKLPRRSPSVTQNKPITDKQEDTI